MFDHVVYGDSAKVITIVAFAAAFSIFVTISWRAVRMKRTQIDHLANLPFTTATPAACHDSKPARPSL
jgi:hypothetical protein